MTKNATLEIRLTDDQRAILQAAAEHAGVSLSAWARTGLLSLAQSELNSEKCPDASAGTTLSPVEQPHIVPTETPSYVSPTSNIQPVRNARQQATADALREISAPPELPPRFKGRT